MQLEQQVQQVVAEVLSNLDAQKTTLQATFLRYAEEDRAAGRSSLVMCTCRRGASRSFRHPAAHPCPRCYQGRG